MERGFNLIEPGMVVQIKQPSNLTGITPQFGGELVLGNPAIFHFLVHSHFYGNHSGNLNPLLAPFDAARLWQIIAVVHAGGEYC